MGCKLSTVRFGTVPGGSKDAKNSVSAIDQRHKDLHRYREKRRAGEQPTGTTKRAMDTSEKRDDLWDRREKDIRDHNSPEQAAKLKKALTNVRE